MWKKNLHVDENVPSSTANATPMLYIKKILVQRTKLLQKKTKWHKSFSTKREYNSKQEACFRKKVLPSKATAFLIVSPNSIIAFRWWAVLYGCHSSKTKENILWRWESHQAQLICFIRKNLSHSVTQSYTRHMIITAGIFKKKFSFASYLLCKAHTKMHRLFQVGARWNEGTLKHP